MISDILELFRLRMYLHKNLYQHHTVNLIEKMVIEALVKADKHIGIPGGDGKPLTLSDSVDDMTAYARVGDWVLDWIMASPDPGLGEARHMLMKVNSRDLYQRIGAVNLTDLPARCSQKEKDLKEELVELGRSENLKADDVSCAQLRGLGWIIY